MTERRLKTDVLMGFCDTVVEKMGRIKVSCAESCLSIIQMLIVPIGLFLFFLPLSEKNFWSRSLLSLLICVMVIHVIQILKDFKCNKLLLEERQNVMDFMQKYNKEMRHLGLRWVLSPSYVDWLELWCDYRFLSDDPLGKIVKDEFPTADETVLISVMGTEGANLLTSIE